jgi:hypothetical protein
VIYGGQVLDDFDRRIVRTYVNEYMGDFLFHTFQPFHFYCSDFVEYVIPEEDDKSGYISKYTKDLRNKDVRFEVFMWVKMSMLVFWVVLLCGLVGRWQHF